MSIAKKIKDTDEGRMLKEQSIKNYFTDYNSKSICVTHKEILSFLEEHNLKHYYKTKQAVQYDCFNGQVRNDKVILLNSLVSKETHFKEITMEQKLRFVPSTE
jgi:hypothetical protein